MTTATTPAPAQTAPPAPPTPPVAKQVEKVHLLHGDARPDPYFWLRDKPNPEVAAYLEAENAYTDAVLKPTEPLQKSLYDEMLAHVKETDLSVPYRDGAFLYYYRTEKGKQYRIHCRKPFPDGPEQVLLDLNALATGKKFMSLGAFRPSDDGSLLAYSTDDTGFRQYTLVVKDLKTGALLPERMRARRRASRGRRTARRSSTRSRTRRRSARTASTGTAVGTPASADALLYEEKDERFGVHVGRTRSRAFSSWRARSHTTSEARVLKADAPHGRVDARRRARAGPRVRRRPPRRPLLHPDELRRPQLPPRDGARRRARAARTGRRSSRTAPTSCSRTSTSSRTTSSSTSARTGSRASRSRASRRGESHAVVVPGARLHARSPRRTACGTRTSSATSTSPSSRRGPSSTTTWTRARRRS